MCFEKAVDLQPDWLEARHNLARALYELGQVSAALAHFRWCAAQPQEASAQARAMIAVIIPGVPEADNQAVLDARRSWAERDLAGRTAGAEPAARSASGQPLRIGYVSSFFHRDNWMKPVWGLINQHDRGIVRSQPVFRRAGDIDSAWLPPAPAGPVFRYHESFERSIGRAWCARPGLTFWSI